jgi:hypothetical protein
MKKPVLSEARPERSEFTLSIIEGKGQFHPSSSVFRPLTSVRANLCKSA